MQSRTNRKQPVFQVHGTLLSQPISLFLIFSKGLVPRLGKIWFQDRTSESGV